MTTVRKYRANRPSSGPWTVHHNLGTADVVVNGYTSSWESPLLRLRINSENTVTIYNEEIETVWVVG